MLNRELEKECLEFRRRWKTQKLVGEGDCAGDESKLRKVERQTRDKKIEKKEPIQKQSQSEPVKKIEKTETKQSAPSKVRMRKHQSLQGFSRLSDGQIPAACFFPAL